MDRITNGFGALYNRLARRKDSGYSLVSGTQEDMLRAGPLACWPLKKLLRRLAVVLVVLCVGVFLFRERQVVGIDEPHWHKYPRLKGYYNGVDSIVPSSNYRPEYPPLERFSWSQSFSNVKSLWKSSDPSMKVFRPYPGQIDEGSGLHEEIKQCYLDPIKKTPVPDVYAYNGIPQHQPLPVMGSYEVLGLESDVCFDRYSRYGAYGLGWSADRGGLGKQMPEGKDKWMEYISKESGYIDYRNTDWGNLQHQCYEANQHRFATPDENGDGKQASGTPAKIERQAVVIRSYMGYSWTDYAILNLRALISEVSLKSGGEYDVHILLHVKDDSIKFWDDKAAAQRILDENVPKEFHSLCTLWSVAQMKDYYPGPFGPSIHDPSASDVHGIHRSAHMPLQHFAVHHPEYSQFWNWEGDIRYIGSYYDLFSRIGDWAKQQPRRMLWERSELYYIPELHGSWESFSELVEDHLFLSGREPILGPVDRPAEFSNEDFLPESCNGSYNSTDCGVGEPADLITLNRLFDPDGSGWIFDREITGYDIPAGAPLPARRSVLVTAGRLSRRLLLVMHREVSDMHHTMFTEMFPPTMSLHHGLKAVYAPHPVYLGRAWPIETVNTVFNGGTDSVPGESPFKMSNEHNFNDATWYYRAEFAELLWHRWLNGAHDGKQYIDTEKGASRLCLRSTLFHPIKSEE